MTKPAMTAEPWIRDAAKKLKISKTGHTRCYLSETEIADIIAVAYAAQSVPQEDAFNRGRLFQFERMKKERPLDPMFWDMHEERKLREVADPAPRPNPFSKGYKHRTGKPVSDACGDGRHAECTQTYDTCHCSMRSGHMTMHAYMDPAPRQATRFDDFDDDSHPFRKWWEKHGQYMMSGGGRRESIWAARGWIAREQLACGVEVTGEREASGEEGKR